MNENTSEAPKNENVSETPKCEVELVPSEDKDWKLVMRGSNPACEEALRKIYQNMGPAGKRLLSSRIEASPEVERTPEETVKLDEKPPEEKPPDAPT
jgi:hypothetical protein